MKRWHVPSIEAVGQREPRVLFSTPECRAVVIDLRAGDELGDHSVRERAVLQVVSGAVSVSIGAGDETCGAGTVVAFDPGERHSVRAAEDTRVLLLLAPWPGPGHYADGEAVDPQRVPANASVPPISG